MEMLAARGGVRQIAAMSRSEELKKALSVSPDNIPLMLMTAQACLDEFALDEARGFFEQALALQPANAEARLGQARVLMLSGRTSEAVIRVEALVREQPQCAPALVLLSRLALTEGNRPLAQQHYRRAREMDGSISDLALEKELYLDGRSQPPPAAPPAPQDRVPVNSLGGAGAGETEGGGDLIRPETPGITFADVGGMASVKEEIRMKILYPLQNAELFKAYGKKIGGGVLLYGPPGCGKTFISRAVAGEIKAKFYSIGIHEILDMWMGNSEKNLHQIFEMARQDAPAVLFFDEVDALAADRNDLKRSAGRTLINQFLAELDGTAGSNEGLLVIGATNAPWHLDPAFRRPGRFDRILFVGPPDEDAREAIVTLMARNKPIADLDARALAKKARNFSGADLKQIFDVTIERCLARAMKEGQIVPITTKELIRSAEGLKPSTQAWFESARNYALYANQGGFYDDILGYLGIRK